MGAGPWYVLDDLFLLPVSEAFFVLQEQTLGLHVCFPFYVAVRWPRFAPIFR